MNYFCRVKYDKDKTQKIDRTMKNSINSIIAAVALSLTIVFSAAAEGNVKATNVNKVLPASAPALDTPAPEKVKPALDFKKYSPEQKMSIVELKVSGSDKK